jgi:hypothetical protein
MPAAAAPKLPPGTPICARPGTAPIFLSPMGEPFRGEAGQPYPSAAWFAGADKDRDGFLTRAEMVADALRFFDTLDTNKDGKLTPDEVGRYESVVAPETSIYAARPDDFFDRSRREQDVGAMADSRDYGGPMGAGRYAWLNVPEPVVAADLDVDRVVTRDEFATAAARIFERLDVLNRDKLRLTDLPHTPQQIAIEGPCKQPKKHKGRDLEWFGWRATNVAQS